MRSSGRSCPFALLKAATSKGKNLMVPKVTQPNFFEDSRQFLERRGPAECCVLQQYLLGTRFEIAHRIS
jgi:hypothetical protein